MRWKCCPLCTGTHDTWDCPKAQKIVESHTGLPFASPRKLNVIELIMEQTYGRQTVRLVGSPTDPAAPR